MNINKPKKSKEIPATKLMIDELRGEFKPDIASLQLKVDSRFNRTDAKIEEFRSELKKEISGVKSEISGIKSELSTVKSDIATVLAAVHRVTILVEEQNARNNYVLDGYTQIYNKIKDLEKNKADKVDTLP